MRFWISVSWFESKRGNFEPDGDFDKRLIFKQEYKQLVHMKLQNDIKNYQKIQKFNNSKSHN